MDTKHITFPEGVPLIDRYEGYDGTIRTIRVIGSRITLDTLVGVGYRGGTYRGVPITLTCTDQSGDWLYLTHRREADEYLEEGEAEAEATWKRIESQPGYAEWREKLLRYREQMSKS